MSKLPELPTKEEQIERMEKSGAITRDCRECQEYFYNHKSPFNAFAPRHTASTRCESGKFPHCTCDTCF